MNLETFPEQAATFLSTLEWIGYVAAGVIYLFYYLPAWKRFRTPALMLLVASCALGLFVVLFDQTLGTTSSLPPNDW